MICCLCNKEIKPNSMGWEIVENQEKIIYGYKEMISNYKKLIKLYKFGFALFPILFFWLGFTLGFSNDIFLALFFINIYILSALWFEIKNYKKDVKKTSQNN